MMILLNAKVRLFTLHRHLQALQTDFPYSFSEKDFVFILKNEKP